MSKGTAGTFASGCGAWRCASLVPRVFAGPVPAGRRLLVSFRGAVLPEAPHPTEELPEAGFALHPAVAAPPALADRAGLPLSLRTVLRPDLEEAAAAPPLGAVQNQSVLGRRELPCSFSAGLPCQLLDPGAVACTAAALRPHRRQAHTHGSRPFLGATVPGGGHGPTGLRSWIPSAGAGLRKTISMAASRLGMSCTFACPSRSHCSKAAAPLPASTRALPPAMGLFLFCPWARSLLGRAGLCLLRSLTAPPSTVLGRAWSLASWIAATVLATCSAASLCRR